MTKTFFLILLLTLPFLTIGQSRGSSDNISDWSMFHRNPAHIGCTTSLAPRTESLRWNYTADGYVFSSPAVADGTVFIGSSDRRIYALDELTGEQIWNYTTAGAVMSSAAVSDGLVFVGSNDGNIYALNEVTGEKTWNYSTGYSLYYSSPTVVDGKVFIGSTETGVYALQEFTGEKVWNVSIVNALFSSPAVADGLVFVGGSQGIYALNEHDGSEMWNYDTGEGQGATSPAVADGIVFAESSGTVYALNETSGTKIWSFGTGMYTFSSPTVADGVVFASAYPRSFYALNETTGTVIWTTSGTTYIGSDFSSPAVADGTVFLGSFDNDFYALNESTGAVIWNLYMGYAGAPYVEASPALADNMVFTAGGDSIYCFGEPVRLPPVPAIISPSPNAVLSSSDVTVHWSCRSIISIGYYATRIDNGPWINTGENNTYTFKNLSNGNHTVYIQAFNRGGLNSTILVNFAVSASTLTPEIVIIVGVALAIILVLFYASLKQKRKKGNSSVTKGRKFDSTAKTKS